MAFLSIELRKYSPFSISEIPNFLNDQEIESMIDAAKKQILKPSEAKSGLQGLVKFKRSDGMFKLLFLS